MGSSPTPRKLRGICFPSSSTSKFHACYYPTGASEQIFQIYFPTPEQPETWKALTPTEGKKECLDLATKMRSDGWDTQFTTPLLTAESVLRVGLRARNPIPVWHQQRVVLLGDAAHPPVPYIGQGAMMAMEDVGILVLLLKVLCGVSGPLSGRPGKDVSSGLFSFAQLETVFELYERLRVPRTTETLERSMSLGKWIWIILPLPLALFLVKCSFFKF
jgi:salicylate hydroxylase